MLLCSQVWSSVGVAHRRVASPEDAVPILTLASRFGIGRSAYGLFAVGVFFL